MALKTTELLSDLTQRTQRNLQTAQAWLQLPLEQLQYKPSADTWSVLEGVEHLNLYGDFYLPEMKQQMDNSNYKTVTPTFKSSWLGNYFAKAMLPKEKLNTMKTFADKNPNGSTLDKTVLEKFIAQQKETLQLLQQAAQVNLTKTKTGITISSWIRLRLGDTFRVVIYHNDRHRIQATQVLNQLPANLGHPSKMEL
ncbi:MAG: DinB family protein [Aureispira sp.]